MIINFDDMIKNREGKEIKDYSCQKFLENSDIDVDDYLEELARKINIEKSTIIPYSDWFLIDGKYYYFKDKYCFEELLMGELFRSKGIRNVEHQIVQNNGKYGIMSENFRKPNNQYVRFDIFVNNLHILLSPEEVKKLIREKMTPEDYAKYQEEKAKIMALDVLFGQQDREEQNVYFELSNNGIALAPAFDNGLSLISRHENSIIYHSCFDRLFFFSKGIDKYTLNTLKEYKQLLTSLDDSMSIDLSEYYKIIEEKYCISVPSDVKQNIINLYDKHRKIAEKTLTLAR